MRRFRFAAIFLALVIIGCKSHSDRAPAIGVAYAGPATLTLRQEISPRSAAAGTAHHGERLDLIQQRRRFFKVRNSKGEEGWTDERLLLTTEEVTRLQRFNEQARTMPSQGLSTSYQALNIHTEPSRFSPSFVQVKPGEKFDVLNHEAAPRKAPPRKPLVAAAPKIATLKKPAKAPKIPPPAAPPSPKPPEDWLALSKTNLPPEEEKEIKEAEPMDDWSLVRTASGQSGWVLTRLLFMAIPDEVAQYAEGRRITSYFPLGEMHDGGEVKKIWLWTTIEQSLQPYDFDSYRVFVWSVRHHRYETAYIQRRVTGYFPVLVEPPGFSVCVNAAGGRRVRRVYSLNGIAVRPAGEKPCEAHVIEKLPADAHAMLIAREQEPGSPSFFARVRDRLRSLRKRWFNR
jgi:hypothetical protein